MNLLALAVGIEQKEIVNRLVQKVIALIFLMFPARYSTFLTSSITLQFPSKNFVVMLFHYDGVVDDWNNFTWSERAIHVSAVNQPKW